MVVCKRGIVRTPCRGVTRLVGNFEENVKSGTMGFLVKRFFLFLFVSCLTSCHKEETRPFRIALEREPATCSSLLSVDLDSMNFVRMLQEGLFRRGRSGEMEPALALSVRVEEEGRLYTFSLKEAYWSDGKKVEASDFVTAWKKILDPHFATPVASYLFDIMGARKAKVDGGSLEEVGVVALDRETLQVRLTSPIPYFLELVALPPFFPAREDPEICCGPCVLKRWDPNDRILLEPNPFYQEVSKVPSVELVVVSPDVALHLLEEGSVDWVGSPFGSIPSDVVPYLYKEGILGVFPFLATSFVRANVEAKGPISSVWVRRALFGAIDREALVGLVLQGGQEAAYTLVPPRLGLDVGSPSFSLEECLLAAEKEGIDWKKPLVLSYLPTGKNREIVQVLQQTWEAALPVTIQLEALEGRVFFSRVLEGKYDLALGSWIADVADPGSFLGVFAEKDNGLNRTGWDSAAYQGLLQQAQETPSSIERKVCFREAETLLLEEAPIFPLYHFVLHFAKKEGISEEAISFLGEFDIRRLYEDTSMDPSSLDSSRGGRQ